MSKIKSLFVLLALFFTTNILAQQFSIPDYNGRFLNLTKKQISSEKIISAINNLELQTNSKVAVLVINSTGNSSIEQYSIKLAEKWKIGEKGKDNGVIITLAIDDKKTRIEVGYGLESVLTDAISSRIIQEHMIPKFKKGQWEAGLISGLEIIKTVVKGEQFKSANDLFFEKNKDYIYVTAFFWAFTIFASIMFNTISKTEGMLMMLKISFIPTLLMSVFIFGEIIDLMNTPYHFNKYLLYSFASIVLVLIFLNSLNIKSKEQDKFLSEEEKKSSLVNKIQVFLFWTLIVNFFFMGFGIFGLFISILIILNRKKLNSLNQKTIELRSSYTNKSNGSSSSNGRSNSSRGGGFGGGGSSGGW